MSSGRRGPRGGIGGVRTVAHPGEVDDAVRLVHRVTEQAADIAERGAQALFLREHTEPGAGKGAVQVVAPHFEVHLGGADENRGL